MIPDTISQIGGFTAFTFADAPDYFAIDPTACTGCDDADLRTTIEDAPGQSGGLILPPFSSAQIMAIVGDLVVTSTGNSNETGYRAALETLFQLLKTSIDALMVAPDDLVHSGGTLKVWKQSKVEGTWPTFWTRRVTFGLAVDLFAS